MSYNGTVYCGYCGNQGHNRRSCPSLKEYVKENPDSYVAQHHNRQRAAAKDRSCSYCHEPGHTRRKCATKDQHVQDFIETNSKYTKEIAIWMKEKGIEPGSLIKVEEHTWDHDTREYRDLENMYLITTIDYTKINYESMHRLGYAYSSPDVVYGRLVGKENHPRVFKLPHHEELHNLKNNWESEPKEPFEVVGKTKSIKAYPVDMPTDFLYGSLGVKELFDGGKDKRSNARHLMHTSEYQSRIQKSENNIE